MKRTLLPLIAVGVLMGSCTWEDFCADGDCGSVHARCDDCARCYDEGCDPCEGNSNDNCRPDHGFCEVDEDCFEDERCEEGICVWDSQSFCDENQDCTPEQVCNLSYECVDIVLNCPLTEECLGDPEGYVPEWMGTDPLYAGQVTGNGLTARVELLVDFYEDHLYGEAIASVDPGGDWGAYGETLIVTGVRSGAQLNGQIVESYYHPRRFDATFTAQLITSSEIVGTVSVVCDEGEFTFELHLYRISPCGCDQPGCTDSAECPADHDCVEGVCVPACMQECCNDTDCIEGDYCVDGVCRTPCTGPCDCPTGEQCVDGYCVPI